MANVRGGVAPEQQATAVLIPFLDDRCSTFHDFGDAPYLILTDALEVAQPEEHAERLHIVGTLDVAEVQVLSGRIGLVQPEPGRSLVVVAIGDEFLRRSVD